jgi:hypothetical protein
MTGQRQQQHACGESRLPLAIIGSRGQWLQSLLIGC